MRVIAGEPDAGSGIAANAGESQAGPGSGQPRRLIRVLAAAVLAVTAAVGCGLVAPRVAAAAPARADHVLIMGAPGLRWGDVNPRDTPTLWKLASDSAIGSLVPRSAQARTCPGDGWLTLGAGNLARLNDHNPPAGCGQDLPRVKRRAGGAAVLPGHRKILADNQRLAYRARPGVLAEMASCTVAIGKGAAAAAARPGVGRVDTYRPRLPEHPGELLRACPLTVVDLGRVAGEERQAAVKRVDARLKRVLAARPEDSLVLITGVSDTGGRSHLRLALANGPGMGDGLLRSSRTGYVPLVDVAPTAAKALGMPRSHWFTGVPLRTDPAPGDLRSTVNQFVDLDRASVAQSEEAPGFALALVVLQVLLCLVAVPVLWRIRKASARRTAALRAQGTRPSWVVAAEPALELAVTAASLLAPAAMIADLFPWWRSSAPGLAMAGLVLVITAALTAGIRLTPWWHAPLGPVACVAAVTVAVVGVDLVTGSQLQLDSVVGYAAAAGGRIVGLSAMGAGVLIAGTLLAAGCLAQRLPRRRGPLVLAAAGGVGVALAGLAGQDPGSAIALTVGVCVAAAICTGSWLTAGRLFRAVVTGVAVTGLLVAANLYLSGPRDGRLSRFLSDLGEGTAGVMLRWTAEANVVTFTTSPFTVLVVFGALYVGLVLVRPSGGLLRVYGLYPALRAALLGSAIAALLGGLVDGSGMVVTGAAAATLLPLTILMCLRVLARARLRTTAPSDPA